jgi:hypothetical protein
METKVQLIIMSHLSDIQEDPNNKDNNLKMIKPNLDKKEDLFKYLKEYILLNKPCLSLNDIKLNIQSKNYIETYNSFKKLVKQKLNFKN